MILRGSFIVLLLFVSSLHGWELPEPYRFPKEPQGGMLCQTCRDRGNSNNPGIQRTTGNMVMMHPLGKTDFLDIGDLLTVVLGGAAAFRPGEYFMVMPPGTEKPKYLVFRCGSDKISFKAMDGTLDTLAMTTPDEPFLKLMRKDEFMVIRNHKNLQDYIFEPEPFSSAWRLREIQRLDAPEIRLRCNYSKKDGTLDSILLPEKREYKFLYENALIVKVLAPNGEYILFEYDSLSHLKSIRTFLKPEHPLHPLNNGIPFKRKYGQSKDFSVRQIFAEYDTDGKLLKLTDENGNVHSAEYRADSDRKKEIVYKETVLTEPDGKKRFFSKEYNTTQNIIKTSEGRIAKASAQETQENKSVHRERTLKLFNNTFVLVKDKEKENIREYRYDNGVALPSGYNQGNRSKVYRYGHLGLPLNIEENGVLYENQYDECGRQIYRKKNGNFLYEKKYDETGKNVLLEFPSGRNIHFEYGEDGMPSKVICRSGDIYSLKWNENRNLISCVRNDGISYEWEYAGSSSLMKTMNMIFPSDDEKGHVTYKFEYAYDPHGRLIRKKYGDETFEAWNYSCCDLLEYQDRLGGKTKFFYDDTRKLVRLIKSNNGSFRIYYNADGKRKEIIYPDGTRDLFLYDEKGNPIQDLYRNGRKITRHFNNKNQIVSEQNSDGNINKWDYDKEGQLLFHFSENQKIEFDEIGQITKISFYTDNNIKNFPVAVADYTQENSFLNDKVHFRTDGLFEKKVSYAEKYMIQLSKRAEDKQVLLTASVPVSEYNTLQTDEERKEMAWKYRDEWYNLDLFNHTYEHHKKGGLVFRELRDMNGLLLETWNISQLLTEHFIYLTDYQPDGKINFRFVPAAKK